MIDDRELLLFHYRDGLSSRRIRRIERRLEQDPALRLRLQQLEGDLGALRPATSTAPATAHGRWRAALADAIAKHDHVGGSGRGFLPATWQRLQASRPLFVPVLAAVVLLSVGMYIGTRLPSPPVPARFSEVATDSGVSPAPATVNVMRTYLVETQRRLLKLDDLDSAGRAEVLAEIRQRNALYVKAAERADWPELARVLRAFDLALISLQDGAGSGDADRDMRRQLEFELNVLQTRIARRASKLAHST